MTPGPDSLVWHEAAHGIVGYRLGMTVHFIDMSGLMIASPVCGLDTETVAAPDRARATGIAALAGPIGEQTLLKGRPIWRQDGEVARVAAKALAGDMPGQMALMIEWSRTAEAMLASDPAYKPLVYLLDKKRAITREEFEYTVSMADRIGSI